MTSREARRYKSRGFSISFGDIMLPLVGVVAVGLLVVGGKLFFLNGARSERRASPVVAAKEEAHVADPAGPGDLQPLPAMTSGGAPEGTEASSSLAVAPPDSPGSSEGVLPSPRRTSLAMDVLAIPYGNTSPGAIDKKEGRGEKKAEAKVEAKKAAPRKSESKRVEVVVSSPPANNGAKQGGSASSPAPKKISYNRPPAKSVPAPSKAPAKTAPPPVAPPAPRKTEGGEWRVQVGAFSTKEAAAETSRKLSQSGYKASVVSGPKFHRVLVHAGATRQDASSLISRLAKAGFSGAFSIPPTSR